MTKHAGPESVGASASVPAHFSHSLIAMRKYKGIGWARKHKKSFALIKKLIKEIWLK